MARKPEELEKVKVQFNLQIPWTFREFLRNKSETEKISQNQLGVDALMKAYGPEYRRSLRGPEPVGTVQDEVDYQ